MYFGILSFGFVYDHLTRPLPRSVQWGLSTVMYGVVIGLFALFSPISFGMEGSSKQWQHLKWLDTWRIAD